MKSIMLDLETLSTTLRASVVSIGAVAYDPTAKDFFVSAEFYRTCLIDEQKRSFSQQTLWWWMQQNDSVRAAMNPVMAQPFDSVLRDFKIWFDSQQIVNEIWSKGADFDLAILTDCYTTYNIQIPWVYKMTRCFRTLCAQWPTVLPPEFKGAVHNALNDARHQAEHHWLIQRIIAARTPPDSDIKGVQLAMPVSDSSVKENI